MHTYIHAHTHTHTHTPGPTHPGTVYTHSTGPRNIFPGRMGLPGSNTGLRDIFFRAVLVFRALPYDEFAHGDGELSVDAAEYDCEGLLEFVENLVYP